MNEPIQKPEINILDPSGVLSDEDRIQIDDLERAIFDNPTLMGEALKVQKEKHDPKNSGKPIADLIKSVGASHPPKIIEGALSLLEDFHHRGWGEFITYDEDTLYAASEIDGYQDAMKRVRDHRERNKVPSMEKLRFLRMQAFVGRVAAHEGEVIPFDSANEVEPLIEHEETSLPYEPTGT